MTPLRASLCALLLAAPSYASEKVLDQLSREAALEAPAAPDTAAKPYSDGRYWAVVRAADKAARTRALETGFSIDEVGPGTIAGVADESSLAELRKQGFEVVKATPLLRFIQDFPPSDADYHDYAELSAELRAIAQSAPGLVSVFSIGKTVQGRDILALRLNTDASGDAPSPKPGAVFTGTFHAREHLSAEVPLLMARWLAENKDDPKVRELLRTRDIYILPMINPDGAEYDISTGQYQWHRKNMSRNADGSTGVDLNRNYGYLWGGAGSSGSPGSDTYRGPRAFSEPESKAFKSFLEARRNVKTLVSYHSYGELVLYPWGGSDSDVPDPKDLAAYKALAGEMGKLTGYTPQKSSELYVATGDATDWAYAALGIFSFTIELGGGGFYPGAGAIGPAAKANLKAALYLLGLSDDPRRAARASAPGPESYPETLR